MWRQENLLKGNVKEEKLISSTMGGKMLFLLKHRVY